jgi:dipeptidyl aminopeptidase/acylaminoacyl peptidase
MEMNQLKALFTPHNFKHTLLASALMAAVVQAGAAGTAGAPLRTYGGLALSAAGDRLVTVEASDPGGLPKRPHGSVVVRDAASGKILTQFDPCSACAYERPVWSADGRQVAFIASDSKAGTATVYVAGVSGTAAKAITTVKGVANTVRWSPDGKQLALLATVGARKETGATQPGAAQVGEIGSVEDEQRIGIVSASGGTLKLVSPDDTFIYEYDWAPNGQGFVATGAKGNGDNNWWVATLGYVDAASGAWRQIAKPKDQINLPKVSPDGKTVAFVGGLMSDFGSIGGDIYTVPLAGGEPVDITAGFAGTFNGLAWRGNGLLASALVGADAAAIAVDPATMAMRKLWAAPVSSSGSDGRLSFSADGAIAAAVQEDFEHPAHIVVGRLPTLSTISHENDQFMPQVAVKNVTWKSDQYNVQGWLIGPMKTEPGKKHPMIVEVHGGPSAANTPRYVADGEQTNPLIRDLINKGYFVFFPNPRGSYGQGEAFTSANKRDFGGGDLRDILAGVDAAEKVAPIDDARLGLFGHSYGGFMTMFGVTHSQRFKAAVAGAGIANWISYYGQNGIDQWMIPFFGASAYDDPAIYRAASPIEAIKSAKTPTFIYVGERDVECPPAQSVEFWHGLRAMGTPTSLVIYEGEGHGIRKPADQQDLRKRELAWFDKYLGVAAQ